MFGKRVNLNEIEEHMRIAGYDCVCTGTDDNLKIYVTELDTKNWVRKYIIERARINQTGFSIVLIDKIPRNDYGKVLYSALD